MRPRLLLYLSHARDLQRFAVAPTLAALVERAGDPWRFDCMFDARRDGRHFGAGDPEVFGPAAGNGSLLAGGAHAEQLLWLTTAYDVVVVGDHASTAWPTLDAAGADSLCRSDDAGAIYAAVLIRLGIGGAPRRLIVVDGTPQGRHRVVVAPYLLPAAFVGGPTLAVDVSTAPATAAAVAALLPDGAPPPLALYVDPDRISTFPIEVAEREGTVGDATYAEVTAELCRRHAAWARGVLLGDPNLVASQSAKAARLRLVPLYGAPNVDVLAEVDGTVRAASEPVYGRQYDDRDFFAIARAGHGLHVVDPPPPFDSASAIWPSFATAEPAGVDEPSDDELYRWTAEGRVLTTLLFWAGMIREADCYPAIVDLLASTGLRAGVVVTVDAVTHAPPASLELLTQPADRGGVHGLVELVLGSTGFGVAAEAEMPDGVLARYLTDALAQLEQLLPSTLQPRAWWPLLDTTLRPHRAPLVTRLGWRPVVHFDPARRSVLNAVIHRTKAYRFVEERRPYDGARPGDIAPAVLDAVKGAGFDHAWTKAGFGTSRIVHADTDGDFVALPFTAGNWDGWSPFYTVSCVADLANAERRLTRTKDPGWLVSTVDSPLWLLSGERQRHGSWLHDAATRLAAGGRSGRLVNTTPSVIARYARLIARR